MKIEQHPRLRDIVIGDEVYNSTCHIVARVEDVFPAAVCVKLPMLALNGFFELLVSPQLWRAEEIENLSVCRTCGTRHELRQAENQEVPFRVCTRCAPERHQDERPFSLTQD